jgi:hypothetical protein
MSKINMQKVASKNNHDSRKSLIRKRSVEIYIIIKFDVDCFVTGATREMPFFKGTGAVCQLFCLRNGSGSDPIIGWVLILADLCFIL